MYPLKYGKKQTTAMTSGSVGNVSCRLTFIEAEWYFLNCKN
jgi:hypothetical protein